MEGRGGGCCQSRGPLVFTWFDDYFTTISTDILRIFIVKPKQLATLSLDVSCQRSTRVSDTI